MAEAKEERALEGAKLEAAAETTSETDVPLTQVDRGGPSRVVASPVTKAEAENMQKTPSSRP